jgi:hypothetical protein
MGGDFEPIAAAIRAEKARDKAAAADKPAKAETRHYSAQIVLPEAVDFDPKYNRGAVAINDKTVALFRNSKNDYSAAWLVWDAERGTIVNHGFSKSAKAAQSAGNSCRNTYTGRNNLNSQRARFCNPEYRTVEYRESVIRDESVTRVVVVPVDTHTDKVSAAFVRDVYAPTAYNRPPAKADDKADDVIVIRKRRYNAPCLICGENKRPCACEREAAANSADKLEGWHIRETQTASGAMTVKATRPGYDAIIGSREFVEKTITSGNAAPTPKADPKPAETAESRETAESGENSGVSDALEKAAAAVDFVVAAETLICLAEASASYRAGYQYAVNAVATMRAAVEKTRAEAVEQVAAARERDKQN